MTEDRQLGAPPETPKKIAQGKGPLSFPEPKAEGKAIANSRSVEESAAAGAWQNEQNMEARSFGEQQR
jgi:hypothetical protein